LLNYNYAKKLVEKYNLNLTGLTVLTEAASGSYLYNPLIAILSNASNVITFCKDSKYGKADDIRKNMFIKYKKFNLEKRYKFCKELDKDIIYSADIITNSGHLRPFNKKFISSLKNKSVLPLMWESWEVRDDEIDFNAAKEHGILVLGTNEHSKLCDMKPYAFLTSLKLMIDQKISIAEDNILIIGNQLLAISIEEGLNNLKFNCRRIRSNSSNNIINQALEWADYILLAEHKDKNIIIGKNAIINTSQLKKNNITHIGILCGLIDIQDLNKNHISFYPKQLAPYGFMSYQPYELGCYPVMNLFAAGLKVGETMARARLSGMSLKESAQYAISHSPAMDLLDNLSWL